MKYLLDTMVLSELRKARPNPNVVRWIKKQAVDSIYLSVISLGEIERGVEKLRKTDADFASQLEQWLEAVLSIYADRLLPVSASDARSWGRLSARLGHDGADLLIAATALSHGFTVVTRNGRHFQPTGVRLLNPFESTSSQ